MTEQLDACGHKRAPATLPGYHRGRVPRNRGRRLPADPPNIEELVALMRACPETSTGRRM